MMTGKRLLLTSVFLGALLASGSPGLDARAQTAPAVAQDSGTLQRADADMRRVIEKLMKLGAKPIGTQSVEETRRGPSPADAVKAVLRDQGKDPAALMAAMGVKKQEMAYPTGGGMQAIRIYTPANASGPLPVIVNILGGGYVIADLDTYESSAMAMAKKTGAIAASAEYRHAPEFRFPVAHDDTFNAYKWTPENAAKFGGDPKRVVIDVAIRPRS